MKPLIIPPLCHFPLFPTPFHTTQFTPPGGAQVNEVPALRVPCGFLGCFLRCQTPPKSNNFFITFRYAPRQSPLFTKFFSRGRRISLTVRGPYQQFLLITARRSCLTYSHTPRSFLAENPFACLMFILFLEAFPIGVLFSTFPPTTGLYAILLHFCFTLLNPRGS